MIVRFYSFNRLPQHGRMEVIQAGICLFEAVVGRLNLVIDLRGGKIDLAALHQDKFYVNQYYLLGTLNDGELFLSLTFFNSRKYWTFREISLH